MPFPSRAQYVGVIPDSGTGRGFCCDLCSSPYMVDPGRRGNQLKTSSSLPSPRHKRDPRTGQEESQRRSLAFEDFVLKNRRVLREELKLCERVTQRILGYSNNFLHKKLQTSSQKPARAERKKGKGAPGLLKPIAELGEEECCADNFTVMAHTYGRLLQHWRDRALMGQSEAHRVLAEMLTPSGGCRCNCYYFRSWVTGSSPSTVSKVNEQMKRLGGDREPPPHKLKQWRKENPKPNKKGSDAGERAQPSQAPSLASPSTAGSQELPSASVHGPASAGEPPTSGTGSGPLPPRRRPCLSLALSQHRPALGEISPCTRRPTDTFSPAPKAASASLTLSSPLPHRARLSSSIHRDLATRGIRPTLRSLHPRPSLLLALSFLVRTPGCVHPISRCREQRNYGKAKSCSLL
nr:uncharacterized protein LOC125623293 isoform X2 [Caretta caretta]